MALRADREHEGALFEADGKEVPLEAFRAQLTLVGEGLIPIELSSIAKNPRKWTAETPYLYSLVLRLKSF
jgi:beta-galactosidase/beta-glucuronidase